MQMGKTLALVSSLTVIGLLAASCAPAAAPTPTAKPSALAPKVETAVAGPTTAPAAPTAQAAVPTAKPAAPAPTPKPAAEQPRYGGILTFGQAADLVNLDMQANSSKMDIAALGPSYSGLLQHDPLDNDRVIGDLAEKWTASPDGLTYTFQLRREVRFHDGTPLTASDVKTSLERMAAPPTRSTKIACLLPVAKVETPDKDTLKITLHGPCASILTRLALGWFGIAPKHVLETKGNLRTTVVGSGPFKFKEYLPGTSLEVVKNPDYYVKGRPYLDGVKTYFIKDATTLFAAFRTGRLMLIYQITYSNAQTAKKETPGITVYERVGNPLAFLMNCETEPWRDVRVRRAVSLATDRQAALKVIAEGQGKLAAHCFPGEWSIPEDELLKMPGYRQPKDRDIEAAKQLLSEAGYSKGFSTTIMARTGTAESEKMVVFMKEQLEKLSIDAKIELVESATYVKRKDDGAFHSFVATHGLYYSDPDDLMGTYYRPPENDMRFKDRMFEELYDKQSQTTNPIERKKLVIETQNKLLEASPSVILCFPTEFWPASKEVTNYKAPVGLQNNWKHQETWLAK